MGVRRLQVSAEFLVSFVQGSDVPVKVEAGTEIPKDAKIIGILARQNPPRFEVELESAEWAPHEGSGYGAMPPLLDVDPKIIRVDVIVLKNEEGGE